MWKILCFVGKFIYLFCSSRWTFATVCNYCWSGQHDHPQPFVGSKQPTTFGDTPWIRWKFFCSVSKCANEMTLFVFQSKHFGFVSTFRFFLVPTTTCCQGMNAAASLLLESPPKWGEAARYASKQHRKIAGRATFQGQVYNFLERPDNWKCFVYHIVV